MENIGTVTQIYDGTLTSDIQVNTFRRTDRLFPGRVVPHGRDVAVLHEGDDPVTRHVAELEGSAYADGVRREVGSSLEPS